MLPRAHPGSATFPPEDGLIRRVVSERDGLAHLFALLDAMETEPSSWSAPSREVYVQRLGWMGDELRRAVAATDSLVLQLQYEQAQWHRALVAGL